MDLRRRASDFHNSVTRRNKESWTRIYQSIRNEFGNTSDGFKFGRIENRIRLRGRNQSMKLQPFIRENEHNTQFFLTMFVVLVTLAFLLLLPSVSFSQTVVVTGPVQTGDKLSWDMPTNVPFADRNTFEVRLVIDTTPATALTNITCTQGPTANSCQTNLTPANIDALNMIGKHDIVLKYFRADVGEGKPSSPFTLTSPAAAPTNLKIIR